MAQIRLLARTFFYRLFESDLMPPGLPQVQLVIWSVVLVATPVLTLPGYYIHKYVRLWREQGTVAAAIAGDRLVLVTLAMIASGLVAIMVWGNAVPDRRDARILGALPIPTAAFVSARLLALGRLFALFFGTLGVIPSIFFCGIAAVYDEPGGFFGMSAAQLLAVLAGSLTTFCTVLAVQSAALRVLGRAMAQRAANVIQALFAVALSQMIFLLPSIGAAAQDGKAGPDWLPSVWFVGLYQSIVGTGGQDGAMRAWWALAATITSVVSAIALYASGYTTMAAQALESAAPERRWAHLWHWPSAWKGSMRPLAGRGAVRAAVRQFTVRTLSRSRQHRTLLALYMGVGLAVVVSSILPVALQRGLAGFTRPGVAVLAAPLVMIFVALVGMRVAFAIPVDVKANWVIRLREPADRHAAIDGVLIMLVAWGVVPFVVLGGAVVFVLWGPVVARQHLIVVALLGWLLAEVLVLGLCKIPFTCTYLPGRSEIKTMWPLYVTAFTAFSYSVAELELEMLRRPSKLAWFMVLTALGIAVVRELRRRWLASEPGLRFEEDDPTALFDGFHLSEGIAASTVPRGRSIGDSLIGD